MCSSRQLSQKCNSSELHTRHKRHRHNRFPSRYLSNRWWMTVGGTKVQSDRETSEMLQYPISCYRCSLWDSQEAEFGGIGVKDLTCGFSCLNALSALFAKLVVIVDSGEDEGRRKGGSRSSAEESLALIDRDSEHSHRACPKFFRNPGEAIADECRARHWMTTRSTTTSTLPLCLPLVHPRFISLLT